MTKSIHSCVWFHHLFQHIFNKGHSFLPATQQRILSAGMTCIDVFCEGRLAGGCETAPLPSAVCYHSRAARSSRCTQRSNPPNQFSRSDRRRRATFFSLIANPHLPTAPKSQLKKSVYSAFLFIWAHCVSFGRGCTGLM